MHNTKKSFNKPSNRKPHKPRENDQESGTGGWSRAEKPRSDNKNSRSGFSQEENRGQTQNRRLRRSGESETSGTGKPFRRSSGTQDAPQNSGTGRTFRKSSGFQDEPQNRGTGKPFRRSSGSQDAPQNSGAGKPFRKFRAFSQHSDKPTMRQEYSERGFDKDKRDARPNSSTQSQAKFEDDKFFSAFKSRPSDNDNIEVSGNPSLTEKRKSSYNNHNSTFDTVSRDFQEKENETSEIEESILLFGPRAVLDALEADPTKIDSVFVLKGQRRQDNERILDLCRASGVRFSLVDERTLDRLAQGMSSGQGRDRSGSPQHRPGQHSGNNSGHSPRHNFRHQGVIARLFPAGFIEFEDLLAQTPDAPLPLIIALDQVQDPGNIGTLARTLYALGGAGLLTPRHNGAFLGYAALKASAGTLANLPVARVANLKNALREAAKQGFSIYGAAHADNAVNVFQAQLRLPAILVLGSEEKGLRDTVESLCPQLLSIPMLREVDSLNVAQSGGIIASQFLARKCLA